MNLQITQILLVQMAMISCLNNNTSYHIFLGEVMLQNIRLKEIHVLYVFIRSDIRSSVIRHVWAVMSMVLTSKMA